MTAEIVIMNREAVALAADSAVTVGEKIYNTANKVFALSKHYPVGVMFYQYSSINNVPWETVIKVYRRSLKDQSKKTVVTYAEDFLAFLGKEQSFITEEIQRDYFRFLITNHFQEINSEVEKALLAPGSGAAGDEEGAKEKIKEIFDQEVAKKAGNLEALTDFPNLASGVVDGIIKKYADIIKSASADIFKAFLAPGDDFSRFLNISRLVIQKDIGPYWSGVVFAGFGEDEVFPSCCSYAIKGVFNNKLLCFQQVNQKIDASQASWIYPFAQSDFVLAFIRGMVPAYRNTVKTFIKSLLDRGADLVVDKVKDRFKIDVGDFDLKPAFGQMSDDIDKKMEALEWESYIGPIVNAVSVLPKDELAALAEALVNLTLIRKRFTSEAETVGGPIDVAVISKGDGLIWVKRKHYFRPDLNPHFFQNDRDLGRGK